MYATIETTKWGKVKEVDGLFFYQQESENQTIGSFRVSCCFSLGRRSILIQLWSVELLLHNQVIYLTIYNQ
jgi:hypothetical protein